MSVRRFFMQALVAVAALATLPLAAASPASAAAPELLVNPFFDSVGEGDRAWFPIDITNIGDDVAPGVTVTAALPDVLTFEPTSRCSETAGTVTCSVGDLAVFGEGYAGFWVRGDHAGTGAIDLTVSTTPTPPGVPVTWTGDVPVVVIQATTDLAVSTVAGAEVAPGARSSVVAVYEAVDGPMPSTVSVTFELSANLVPVPDQAPRCAASGQVVTCSGPFDVVSPQAIFIPTAPGAGTVTTTVTSERPEPVPDPNPNTVTDSFTIVGGGVADLEAGLYFFGPGYSRSVDTRIGYSVTNHGPGDATAVVTTIDLPTSFVVSSPPVGCTMSGPTQLECRQARLRPGSTNVWVDGYFASAGPAATQVSVTSGFETEPAPDPHPNVASGSTTVADETADLEVELTAGPTQLEVGERATYAFTLTNHGPATIPRSWVNLRLDEGVGPGAWAAGDSCERSIVGVWVCEFPTAIAPNDSITVSFELEGRYLDEAAEVGARFGPITSVREPRPDVYPSSVAFDIEVVESTPRVLGRVSRAAERTPVDGAQVWIYAPGDLWVPSTIVASGLDGYYRSPQLAPGTYVVAIGGSAGSGLASEAHTVVVADGATTLDVALDEIGAIAGVVRGPGGAPIAGATVHVFEASTSWVPNATVVTGSDGSYSAVGLPPGSYRLAFRAPTGSGLLDRWHDDAETRAGSTAVTVTAGGTMTVDAELTGPGSIAGRVTAAGAQVEGIRVLAYRATDGIVASARTVTAADGTYVLVGLAPGTYKIGAIGPSGSPARWYDGAATRSTAQEVVVGAGSSISGLDIELSP
jgi:hypothetical protein